MIGVARQSVAGELTIDFGPTSLCVFVFLKNENTGPFSHDKSVPVAIKWTRGPLRLLVPRTHGPHRTKTADTQGTNDCFGSSGQKDFAFTAPDHAPCFSD